MFGDAGHGLILLLFGLYMVVYEKKLLAKKINSEIWTIFFSGRYIILLMGMFSIYTGIIYNDVFSKSLNIFGSQWELNYDNSTVLSNEALELNPNLNYLKVPYPVGIDPVWQVFQLKQMFLLIIITLIILQIAKNKIIFLNSYKMKLSIIFGVVHMIFGVCMSVVNYK